MNRSARASSSKPCLYFSRGKCSFGTRCKFSHQTAPAAEAGAQVSTWRYERPQEQNPAEDLLRVWKRLFGPSSSNPRFAHQPAVRSQQICDQFFTLALELMDGDVGAAQEAIKLFAKDDGLSFLRSLVDRHISEAISVPARVHLWRSQVQPLFQLLTHPRVVDSNVLEQEVAAIYNFMQGSGAGRMRVLFDFIFDLLDRWSTLPMDQEDEAGISACQLSLSILAKMVDCNTSNIVNVEFSQVVERFSNLVQAAVHSSDQFSKLQAEKYLEYLRRRLGVGDGLFEAQTKKHIPVTRADFVMQRDLPGRLSAEGPRHDNDHADICDISILPTHQEIVSMRSEYLPTTDSSQFHIPGIRGRLDREFRLLREDTVGQLRDAVRAQIETVQNPNRNRNRDTRNALRTYKYEKAAVFDVRFSRHHGLDLLIQFKQPNSEKDLRQRQDWWTHSKRLQPGGLVCVISDDGSVIFCVVADSTIVTSDKKGIGKLNRSEGGETATDTHREPSLGDDDQSAFAHLHLAEVRSNDVGQALRWYRHMGPYKRWCLVEFPGVLLPSFQHTLLALQRMSTKLDIPFTNLIASNQQDLVVSEIDAPQYAMKPGFAFDLTCLTNDATALRCSPRVPLDPQELTAHSTLDPTQSSALLGALLNSLAMIQGPPGTGKSFTGEKIIKVLLANGKTASLGPILCVCYTNHALDQLLVHLKREGFKIIRIGSRSKSEELEGVNLRLVAQSAYRTKAEKRLLWELTKTLDEHVTAVNDSAQELKFSQSPRALETYLSQCHPQHHHILFGGQDEEGWYTVRSHSGRILEQWLKDGTRNDPHARQVDELLETDLWSMAHSERSRLHAYWLRGLRDRIITNIVHEYRLYEAAKKARDRVSRDVDLRCLHAAEVVGVTTTGLAKNLDLLQKLRCKVMICEEAGEVLEAHILTALLSSVEHAILIGDHLQLRPQIQNYELQSTNSRGSQHSLDVSLFERLINPLHDGDPRLPYNTLDTQRRMHPSVSELIRSTLYPSLGDGGAVAEYPEVVGMRKRLFWFDHDSPEDQATQTDATATSRTNRFEVDMTVALVQHLVRQGSYGPDDIAVITPYLGQLVQLRRRMENLFEISVGDRDLAELEAIEAGRSADEIEVTQSQSHRPSVVKTTLLKSIRLATVDNFQGEEAKVVVISLVRSNEGNKCGFLSTSNRINVLLSRAQHGMYLIGNSNTYGHVDMWAKVLQILERNGNKGAQLELQCPRHPDAHLLVSQPDDFLTLAPEGGCILPCERRLPCGHSCVNRCHHENLHNAVKCLEPCPRPKKGCEHPCRLNCGDRCDPKCNERLEDLRITLDCGHKVFSASCWQAQDPTTIICKRIVEKKVPGCNHTVNISCHTDVSVDQYKCQTKCLDPLPCGHSCQSACYQCKERADGEITNTNHGICKQKCGRKYTTCRHDCQKPCHGEAGCPPCPVPCEVRCSHSKCSKACHEPCVPCAEHDCSSSCAHTQCTMPCAAPCDWVPCSLRCEKVLTCGHRCPSLCGEVCPDTKYCQSCCTADVKSVMVDFLMAMEYHEIDLDEDPCIFLDCGHFFTKSSMDGVMDMKAHYAMSTEENPTAVSRASAPFSMDEVKACPTCRGSLRNIARYGRIVRRAMLDEATKKFIAWSNSEYLKLADRQLDVQVNLSKAPPLRTLPKDTRPAKLVMSNGRLKQLHLIRDWVGGNRYTEILQLWRQISSFSGLVKKEEQPFQRVADFVQHAARQRRTDVAFHFDESRIQNKGRLQATALSLRCDIIIVSDFMELRNELLQARPELKLDFSKQMNDCKVLMEDAKTTKYPRQETEANIYFAQFCAFTRALSLAGKLSNDKINSDGYDEALEELAMSHLAAARALVDQYSGQTKGLSAEIDTAEIMLRDGVSYSAVSPEEMRAVYEAMALELRGTGHWYTCENGHPFTVGECGMPMEEARCPECAAAVGGQSHMPAQGVRRADEIERLARGIDEMDI